MRRTVGARVEVSGVGLHYGRTCRLAFLPATAGAGVRFRRTDLPGAPETPAHVSCAVATERRT
ncbi:MAG: UDP-3-O-acyl-N-acetylglucosamine deacetylase, partial [Gemmatimonadota bacterium]|nr:UDP-3-O-acyl-N-acetylglucosamine deacetylase [Gemmatimonadota bacterium]